MKMLLMTITQGPLLSMPAQYVQAHHDISSVLYFFPGPDQRLRSICATAGTEALCASRDLPQALP